MDKIEAVFLLMRLTYVKRGFRRFPRRKDAANQPEDAARKLQAHILSAFIDQNDLQSEPVRPKASNRRRGCNQSARGCPQEVASIDFG